VTDQTTDQADRVLELAQDEARDLHHSYIGTEHILLALVREPDGSARRQLEGLGITHAAVRSRVVRMMGTGVEASAEALPFSVQGQAVVDLAHSEAARLGQEQVGTEHILLALVHERQGAAARILYDLDVDPVELREDLNRSLGETGTDPGD
jgi:ATP-dependent Clp protease ATP-binding subunit ClpC